MMMSDLPEDLVEEILCRVPATSLNRSRSTCKRWKSLFNNKNFTRKHFEKAAKQFQILMLKSSRICTVSVKLDGNPSIEVTGKLSLIDPHSSLDQFQISQVFHCDGLLLCTNRDSTRVVVWNPCTGQTRWIQPSKKGGFYALGSYQDKKSGNNNSYKILCHREMNQKFEVYEFNSNSWRILEASPECSFLPGERGVYLKGKTYWFAIDEKEKVFIVSFDYTRERFGRLCLPSDKKFRVVGSLSVVREDKLWVLSKHEDTPRTEIWVTTKIGETTKEISWSMVLAVDLKPEHYFLDGLSIFVHDEKNAIMCCEAESHGRVLVYIVGQDNKLRQVGSGFDPSGRFSFNYTPSLIQIQ